MSCPERSHYQEPGECRGSFESGPLLHNILELAQPALRPEFARRIRGARVVMAHYELLRHDFPHLRSAELGRRFAGLATVSAPVRRQVEKRLIERWLLRNTALVSECQAEKRAANTAISVGERRYPVFRPPHYGRAVVVSLLQMRRARGEPQEGPRGLIDLKGAGMEPGSEPSPGGHSTGVVFLGHGLSDLLHEELVRRLFDHAGAPFRALPTYALIDCGFDGRFTDGSQAAACIQVRRAHRRARGGGDIPHSGSVLEKVRLEVELLLRRYGITTCSSGTSVHFRKKGDTTEVRSGHHGWRELDKRSELGLRALPGWRPGMSRFDGVNVQTTAWVGGDPRAVLVDFGHYRVRSRFEFPVLSLVSDRPLRWGGAQEEVHQPDPALVPDAGLWEPLDPETNTLPLDGPSTGIQARCFELAEAWAEGRASGRELRRELDRILDDATRKWT